MSRSLSEIVQYGREGKKKPIIVPPTLSFCEFHNLALNLANPDNESEMTIFLMHPGQ